MNTPGSYLVQFGDMEYEDPNYYVHIVRDGEFEYWFTDAILVDRETRDRWQKACDDWAALQADIAAIVAADNGFKWQPPPHHYPLHVVTGN